MSADVFVRAPEAHLASPCTDEREDAMDEFALGPTEDRSAFLEGLINTIGCAIWEFDWDSRTFTFVSEGGRALLGYAPEEWLVSGFWTARVHPEDESWVRSLSASLTERLEPHEITYRMMHRNGSVVWVRDIITPARRPDGRLLQRGMLVDVTPQMVAEQSARHAETGFRDMVEAGGRLAMKIDEIGRFTYVSSALCELVGKSESELLGTPFTQLLEGEERRRVMFAHRDHMSQRRVPRSFRVHLRNARGERRLITLQNTTLFDRNGAPCGATAMGEDVTERTAMRRELERRAEEFGTVMRLLRDTYVRVDSHGFVRDVKAASADAFSIDSKDIVGRNASLVFPVEIADAMREAANEALGTGETATIEYRIEREGRSREFEARLLPFAGDQTAMVIRDVTERHARQRELTESLEFVERLLGLIDSGVLVIGMQDLRVISANTPAEWIFGYAHDELVGLAAKHLFPTPESAAETIDGIRAQIAETGRYHGELCGRRRDGSQFEAELSVRLIENDSTQLLAVVRDITDRVESERQVRASEESFRTIVEAAPFGLHFYRLGERGNLVLVGSNPAADRMFGHSHSDAHGTATDDAHQGSEAQAEIFSACRRIARRGGTYQAEQAVSYGGKLIGAFAVTVFQTGPGMAGVAFVDITERQRTAEREHSYQARLAALSAELIGAEDRERRRLAEELHDRVSQSLAVARMHLSSALESAPEIIEEAQASLSLLDEAIGESRAITTELSPPVLYELGLGPALQWLAERFHEQHGLDVTVSVSEDVDCSEEVSAFFFRSARELLINIVKHAKTRQVWLSLDDVGGCLVLTVEDQGVGFDLAELHADGSEPGFGLFSIGERARYLGGTFELESTPGGGTRATVELQV